ncbi:uncharacterized protein F4812DRAFT_470418 [Daldinia caldariorum]|uniref:uncharacterized protein n=1 Tax=Daldinia caldariorum TaxID=326644 RepID=UPI002007C67D|nr:uncharacterized protein F4812DRAFT_470418 [Daldinia caldariorum]KAI1469491.1 hypothetical protein F4812DRAFT_470418 [Daldinia caldariorum]
MADISLQRRAPTKPIPKISWLMFLEMYGARMHYEEILEQANICIRSQLVYSSTSSRIEGQSTQQEPGFSAERNINNAPGFPYPRAFLDALRGYNLPYPEHVQQNIIQVPVGARMPDNHDIRGPLVSTTDELGAGLSTNCFGMTFNSTVVSEYHLQPIYLVIGIFPRGHVNPQEKVVYVQDPKEFLSQLRWGCDLEKGTHESVDLDRDGVADLVLLLDAYTHWNNSDITALIWADWIHQVLNNSSHDIRKGSYSLELVLGWSAKRISIVVMLPVLLSLAVGIWLNSSNWYDLDTVQTAWGTASYIATAGGLTAALLGILSSIADR